jgi:DNA-binding response OmpR family regulator
VTIPPILSGKRVLVVEDEYLIAAAVEGMLEDAGCHVVGPFARVQDALDAVRTEAVDVALLDVNVAGELVFPVAHLLEESGTPFLFVTGYGDRVLPFDRPHWSTCTKPFHAQEVLQRLARCFQGETR